MSSAVGARIEAPDVEMFPFPLWVWGGGAALSIKFLNFLSRNSVIWCILRCF